MWCLAVVQQQMLASERVQMQITDCCNCHTAMLWARLVCTVCSQHPPKELRPLFGFCKVFSGKVCSVQAGDDAGNITNVMRFFLLLFTTANDITFHGHPSGLQEMISWCEGSGTQLGLGLFVASFLFLIQGGLTKWQFLHCVWCMPRVYGESGKYVAACRMAQECEGLSTDAWTYAFLDCCCNIVAALSVTLCLIIIRPEFFASAHASSKRSIG